MPASLWKAAAIAIVGLLTTVLPQCLATPAKIALRPAAEEVGRFEKIEFTIDVPMQCAQPFDVEDTDVSVNFTTPGGQQVTVPAFYCQQYERKRLPQGRGSVDWMYPVGLPAWKARFAPAEVGNYSAVARLKDRSGTAESAPVKFACTASSNKGYVRISQKDPRFLAFDDGTPFFAIGQNLAFIGEGQHMTLAKTEDVLATLSKNGANYLRIWTCCEDWAMAIEARKSAFGRSWGQKATLVPLPDAPAGSERKCVKLAGSAGATLAVTPSHRVALRPGTKYVFSARVKTEGDAAVRFEVGSSRADKDVASGADGGWAAVQQEFTTGANDYWLGAMNVRLTKAGTALIDGFSLKEAAGGPELLWEADPNRAILGNYNPVDCFMLDELLASAEKNGIYLQLCLLTRDLYMHLLKNDKSPEYDRAIANAKRTFRYAVARWGYSPNVAAWEYWNELDPGLPTDRFYTAMGEYLEQIDPYRHLRTTSTWHPSPKDMRHPKLDLADLHYYYRPADAQKYKDEVDALLDRTRFLLENSPNKPAHLGEFGLANDKFQPTDEMRSSKEVIEFHNAMWASALSGASGTCMFWWWERLDKNDAYPHYRPLSAFLADIPWTTAGLQPRAASVANGNVRIVGLQCRDRAYLWLFNPQAAWRSVVIDKTTPAEIKGATVEIKNLKPGKYLVEWWDTTTGKAIREEKVSVTAAPLQLTVPDFNRDIACKIVLRK
jgi:hypothetical protein